MPSVDDGSLRNPDTPQLKGPTMIASVDRSAFPSPQRGQSGMSLLEIIIVIVLIGAVLTLVASRVLGGADRGKANIAKAQVQTVASKVDNYQIDTGKLPGSLNDLVTAPAGVAGWLGPYASRPI